MNAAQAKRIPLEALLAHLGHEPSRRAGQDLYYRSPFRAEREPSFHVNAATNRWYDFGPGEGGDVVDLARRLWGVGTSEALRRLADPAPAPPALVATQPAAEPQGAGSPLTITRAIRPVRHPALLDYLRERGIWPETAAPYLHEIHFVRAGRPGFALGFASDASGYELRNRYGKFAIGRKDVTLLDIKKGGCAVALFEGFFDFLTAIQLDALPAGIGQALVLNSTALYARALTRLVALSPTATYLFLDRDPAGLRLTASFVTALACPVIDASAFYAGHKDLNALLMARQGRGQQ